MRELRQFFLVHPEARQRAVDAVRTAPEGYRVRIEEPTRNLDQNAAMWALLECFAVQRKWPVNGEIVSLSSEEWKDILTAAFNQEQVRLAQGLNGGVVMLGQRTSKFSKKRFGEFLEFLNATAIQLGIETE